MTPDKPRLCLDCGKEIEGRIDKIFCNKYCRSSYQYKQKKLNTQTLFKRIDLQLKRNRNLLKHYNQAGKATIRKDTLLKAGFNPNYFTNYWKIQNGDVYLFCYEYGFLTKTEHQIQKYIL